MEKTNKIKDFWNENKKMVVSVGAIVATGAALAVGAVIVSRQEPTLDYDEDEDLWYIRDNQDDMFAESDTVDYSKDEEA